MNKKKILTALVVVAVLILPFSVFAATSNASAAKAIRGFFGIDSSKLTDQQKADVEEFAQKMADLQKDFINKMISNGAITQEQGDAAIKRIDDALQNGGINRFLPGFGMGKGSFDGSKMKGDVMMGKIDTSKLTDQQKTDLLDTYKKMADLQKEFVNKLVANGFLTQVQGDSILQKIDKMIAAIEEKGLPIAKGILISGFEGFDCFGINRIDTSKLTDQQKADFEEFSKKMADLKKEFINKMVNYGLITAEQADAAIKNIDNKLTVPQKNGFSKDMKMKQNYFNNKNKQGNFNGNSNRKSSM